MIERTETLDLAELPAEIKDKLIDYIWRREQFRGQRGIRAVPLKMLTATYAIVLEGEPLPGPTTPVRQGEAAHEDWDPQF